MLSNSISRDSPHATTSFYNRVTAVESSPERWLPGQFIDATTQHCSMVDFHSIVSAPMQSSISSHLNKLDETLSTLTSRLEKIEGVTANTAKFNMQFGFSTPQFTVRLSSCESSRVGSGLKQRKWHVPTGLAGST